MIEFKLEQCSALFARAEFTTGCRQCNGALAPRGFPPPLEAANICTGLLQQLKKAELKMKQISTTGANSMIKAERGIIYSGVQKKQDGQYAPYFKFFDFVTNSAAIITKDVFSLAKFGKNYELITPKVKDLIHSRSAMLPGGRVLVCERDGNSAVFGSDGSEKWRGVIKYKGFGPSDVAADGIYIWCTFPESNAVIKYNTNSMRHDFVIGGSASGGLNEPHSVFFDEDKLIIASLDGSICYISLDNFQIVERLDTDEIIYQYTKTYSNEVILCRSGIYTLY